VSKLRDSLAGASSDADAIGSGSPHSQVNVIAPARISCGAVHDLRSREVEK
jgi:hypothetical protein